jgi:formiminotetrahydrofolate cyclodeaminase
VEPFDLYLERLASSDAVPGGGSAAAVVAAIGAALVAMVGRIGANPPDGLVEEADRLRAELDVARKSDEAAYAAFVAARALPKSNESERAARDDAVERALKAAAQSPLDTAALAVRVLELVERLLKVHMGALVSDVGCAAEFAHAAVIACGYNVRVNHRYMHDEAAIREQAADLFRYEGEATRILQRARDAVARGRPG